MKTLLITLLAGLVWAGLPSRVQAQDGLYGQVYMTAAYCRAGSVEADGRMLDIRQNQPLNALLGSTFGGDDHSTFGVPDLRSKAPIGIGRSPDGRFIGLGARLGSDQAIMDGYPSHDHAEAGHTHTLAPHTHSAELNASSSEPSQTAPQGHAFATFTRGRIYAREAGTYGRMAEGAVQTSEADAVKVSAADGLYGTTGIAGGGEPVDIRDPFLGIKFCIVTNGTFPSRP